MVVWLLFDYSFCSGFAYQGTSSCSVHQCKSMSYFLYSTPGALRALNNWKKVIAGGFSAFCPEGACAISHGRKPVERVGHDLQPQQGDSKTRINACYPLCSRPVGAKIHNCIPSTGLRPWLAAQASVNSRGSLACILIGRIGRISFWVNDGEKAGTFWGRSDGSVGSVGSVGFLELIKNYKTSFPANLRWSCTSSTGPFGAIKILLRLQNCSLFRKSKATFLRV